MSQPAGDGSSSSSAMSTDQSASAPGFKSASASAHQPLVNWSLLDDMHILESCRRALENDGAMVLPNFATLEGLQRLKNEVLSCPYNESKQHYTPWQDQGDHTTTGDQGKAKYSESHPRNHIMHSSAAFIGRKSLEQTPQKLCLSLFNDDRLVQFLSKVAQKGKLHRSQDENGSVYSYRIHPEHDAPWHFDESPYTAILYLQNSEDGGEFEHVPWCRPTKSKDDIDGHSIVRKILMEGRTDDVRQIKAEPGTLIFFSGAHSFHRAAPISGPTIRLGLVFTFGEEEGFANSGDVKGANEWDPADATQMLER